MSKNFTTESKQLNYKYLELLKFSIKLDVSLSFLGKYLKIIFFLQILF